MADSAAHLDLQIASAISTAKDTDAALDEVTAVLGDRLGTGVDLAFVFATLDHQAALERVHARLGSRLEPRVMVGCTGAGVIGVRQEVESGPGLSVLAAVLPGAILEPFSYEQIDWPGVIDQPADLRQAVTTAEPDELLRAILLLADPFSAPMVKLLPNLTVALPGVPVIGGMASGSQKAGGNRLMLDGALLCDGAVGVAIRGAVDIQSTVSQGCRPIGKPYVITKAKRHLVQELGGHNALGVIKQMAQDLKASEQRLVQANGLFVGRVIDEYKGRFGRGDFLVRGLVGVDADAGYVAIGDPQVRVGQTIQFHVRDQQTAASDFAMLLEAQKVYGAASGVLLFSCNGRGRNLFERPHADAMSVHDALGDVPLAGFFAAGEIGPVGEQNFVHSHTASLAVFRQVPPNRADDGGSDTSS